MSQPTKVVLCGIGGYGATYTNAVLNRPDPERWQVVAAVDPFAEKARAYEALKKQGIPFFSSIEDFYAQGQADLAVFATPIQLHCQQSCLAVSHGSNVLCEKPIAAIPEQAYQMLEAQKNSGHFIAIGYQWSFSPAIQALKADILAGRFGAPKRLRSLVLWPRNDAYYGRNNWAGGQKSANGDWILDSPVNNAAAHYLHNMLYVLGDKVDRSAKALTLEAELYRANPITNYDTASIRVTTSCGAKLLFVTSHAISRNRGPEFIYEFENGTATFNIRRGTIQATFSNGESRDYGNPNHDSAYKFFEAIAATRGEGNIVCGVEAAIPHCLCVWAAQESCPEITEFPARNVYKMGAPGSQFRVMEGLAEDLEAAYAQGKMLHEVSKAPWCKAGKQIKL